MISGGSAPSMQSNHVLNLNLHILFQLLFGYLKIVMMRRMGIEKDDIKLRCQREEQVVRKMALNGRDHDRQATTARVDRYYHRNRAEPFHKQNVVDPASDTFLCNSLFWIGLVFISFKNVLRDSWFANHLFALSCIRDGRFGRLNLSCTSDCGVLYIVLILDCAER